MLIIMQRNKCLGGRRKIWWFQNSIYYSLQFIQQNKKYILFEIKNAAVSTNNIVLNLHKYTHKAERL